MANVLVEESSLSAIADSIRAKNGTATTYKPAQMSGAIDALPSGGITPTGTLSIASNNTYDVTNYASVDVNVPSVSPTGTKSISITQNGTTTEDVTNYASAEISVSVPSKKYVRVDGSYNFVSNKLSADFTQGTLKRSSFWDKDGSVKAYIYLSSSNHTETNKFHPIMVPSGATKIKVTVDQSCQVIFAEFTVVGDTVTARPNQSSWANITANTQYTYTFAGTPDAIGVSFRYNSSNTAFTGLTTIYDFAVEFE